MSDLISKLYAMYCTVTCLVIVRTMLWRDRAYRIFQLGEIRFSVAVSVRSSPSDRCLESTVDLN